MPSPGLPDVDQLPTGLKFSARRPFDLFALPDDTAQQRWLAHRPGLTAFDLGRSPASASLLVHNWARLIHRLLSSGDFSFLREELARPRADFTLDDLPVLGLQLLDEFEAGAMKQPEVAARQAHAAHRRFQKSCAVAGESNASVTCAPSKLVDADSPQVVAQLEALDDAVFDAVQGKAAALAELYRLWPALRKELGDALLAESREQYIRFALFSLARACQSQGRPRSGPGRPGPGGTVRAVRRGTVTIPSSASIRMQRVAGTSHPLAFGQPFGKTGILIVAIPEDARM